MLGIDKIVWTSATRRMYTLVNRCLEKKEPALLVGETGYGKTTVCQALAIHWNQSLRILNCHQNTDTTDIIGSLRPIRNKQHLLFLLKQLVEELKGTNQVISDLPDNNCENDDQTVHNIGIWLKKYCTDEKKLAYSHNIIRMYRAIFEWQDGPLVLSMKRGDMFLLDELSLAEDAVLERLNSVLEPSRTLFLAEKGGNQTEEIKANENFRNYGNHEPRRRFWKA